MEEKKKVMNIANCLFPYWPAREVKCVSPHTSHRCEVMSTIENISLQSVQIFLGQK